MLELKLEMVRLMWRQNGRIPNSNQLLWENEIAVGSREVSKEDT